MSEDVLRFAEKAAIAFVKAGGRYGSTVNIGNYQIDHVPEAGIWVYEVARDGQALMIFACSYRNRHSDFGDETIIAEAREAFLRFLILEELADV